MITGLIALLIGVGGGFLLGRRRRTDSAPMPDTSGDEPATRGRRRRED